MYAWHFVLRTFSLLTFVTERGKALDLAQPVVRLKGSPVKVLVFALSAIVISLANADQGSFANSGGSTSAGSTGVTITSNVASPAGTLNLNCPEASPSACAGGDFTFASTDGSSSLNASFISGRFVETCSGGGRGGHVTCSWAFTGYFSGTWTHNGQTQVINGVTYQAFGTGGAAAKGTTGYNSAYTPFYFTDGNARILRSDDLTGTNAIAYGTQGSGTGQFYGPSGIALDSEGRIYITDTYNDRIVRIHDMHGTNWASFGAHGSGVGQFATPQSVSIDPSGHIWVLDNGNGRLVRMDDMNGTNWTTIGTGGSGVGQFAGLSSAPGFDSLGRIYLADMGNRRIVRFDDLKFTNWTTLSQSQPIGPYIYQFSGPIGVVVDHAGKIYVADGTNVIRVDDMTGTNWTSVSLGTFPAHTIAIDSSGMILVGNGYNAQIVDSEAAVLTSNITGLVQGVYVSVYGGVPLSLPSPPPPAIYPLQAGLTFAKQNIGTTSTSQPINITNFGGSPLVFSVITANGGFVDSDDCPPSLIAGSSCTISVSFAPTVTGPAQGSLTLSDNSGNLGSQQAVLLTGLATAPVAYIVPGSLVFPSQVLNVQSAAQSVVLLNTGTGPLQVNTVTASAPFSQTNNCAAPLAPGAGCTISVSFTPTATGPATGTLTITNNASTQTVHLSGTGSSTAPAVTVSPASLLFPEQLLNKKSASQGVTIANNGTTAVLNKGVTVTGDFAKATTCTSALAPKGTCTVTVTFTPIATGTLTGKLTINLSTGAQAVQLTGTGSNGSLPGVLSLSPSPLTFNGYTIGDNPSQTVTVTNTTGAWVGILGISMQGDASLTEQKQCGPVLAAGASCSITVTFQPTAYGTFTSTLTVVESSGARHTVPVTGNSSPDS